MADEMFDALRDKRRRQLLINLLECDPRETVLLRDAIPEGEAERELLYTQLTHNHLPKLNEMGYIQWNQESDEITRGPRFEVIEPSLELLITHAEKLPEDLI